MGKIIFFLWGGLITFLKMLLGSAIVCGIVGFFFFPALYVLVPLCLLASVVEAYKGGLERAGEHQSKINLKKLKKAFKEDELYEFDRAWKQASRS
ncbi:MAG: hypothetical protein U9Q88_14350 [Bacillota bacterium]|nr:hypothetical protein [Bacillota bacterium]